MANSEGEEVTNRQVILRDYVSGFPEESDMILVDGSIQLKVPTGSNGILLKNLYLSCDPYMRIMMTKNESHDRFTCYTPGLPLTGYGVAKVINSTIPDFMEGDLVWGLTRREQYSLFSSTEGFSKIQHIDIPLSYYTGILGWLSLTAYVGFFEIGCPKKGEHVFVSAASGGVGQLVGQFAKLMGCHVVGIARTNEKVDLLNKLGFDDAFNCKEGKDMDAALKRYYLLI
ncbi:hypothetical protein L6164_002733 [Bauhinia variegata]|uniref:Uncharacterized protein n=1 Tax=Bauhinia variegata TaxID=167791 RepID=A0ACB9Q1S2_BAUVA|nr:hypothetical protein L6164_002733 [Bauhinia variegata]